ncbi:MAG: NUDIX hydrolase [Eubacterium sp.]|nr:NUDIX hydrolase [Eubacterium sp.]
MKKFKRIKRTVVHKGAIIDMCRDDVITPDGNQVEWDYLIHNGAAAVIPVMDDGKILMTRQWRNAVDKFALEIPAGGKDGKDEPTIECARRELEEETGYKSDNIEFLQTIIPAIAYSGETIDIYVAKNLEKSEQNLDEDEDIEIEMYSLDELVEMIQNNEINDAKTIAAIMTYYSKKIKNI